MVSSNPEDSESDFEIIDVDKPKKTTKKPVEKSTKTKTKKIQKVNEETKKVKKRTVKKKTFDKDECKRMIEKLIIERNQPINHTIVYDSLKKAVPKTKTQSLMEELASEERIIMKMFKNTKIFFPSQKKYEDIKAEDIKETEQKCLSLLKESEIISKRIQNSKKKISDLKSSFTDEKIEELQKESEFELKNRQEKIANLKKISYGEEEIISNVELESMTKNLNNFSKEWAKRKRIVVNMVEALLGDTSTKTDKEFLKENGCETDEDAFVNIADYKEFDK